MIEPAERARRYGRQMLLLGEAGQLAIERASARVCGEGLVSSIASAYAAAAGFDAIASGEIDVDELAPVDLVQHEAPRAVLAASRAVLAEMVRAAGVDPGPAR